MRRAVIWGLVFLLALTGCGAGGGETARESDTPGAVIADNPAEEPQVTSGGTPSHDTEIPPPEGDVVEISERLFIAQTNDIYINTEDYLGKTIKYEGMFKRSYWPEVDETYYFVIRYGPGCCGYDGEAGFEVSWDGEWPQQDDWCEAVGTLETYEMDGWQYLRLALSSLTVLKERGAEYVST